MSAPAPDLHLRHPSEWPAFLTIDEAARILRVRRSSAYEMAAAGSLPTVKFSGRSLRVPRGALAQLAGESLTGAQPVSTDPETAADLPEPAGGGTEGHSAEQV